MTATPELSRGPAVGVQPAATGEFLPVGGCWLIGHSSQWIFVLLTRDRLVCVSRSVVSDSLRPHGLQPARLLCPWDSSGKITGIGCHTLLQGIFPTQGSNPAFPHCRRILYRLSPQESPGCAEAEFIQCLPRDPANAHTGWSVRQPPAGCTAQVGVHLGL